MTVKLLIAGMNRTQYLNQVSAALEAFHPGLYANRLELHDIGGLGMAGAIQYAWETVLKDPNWEYLLHHEEDMLPLAAYPVDKAVAILKNDPALANIVFKREPWSNEECATGDVIASTVAHATTWHENAAGYTVHDHIFSLNPCLIPRQVIELGWNPGNEAGMTDQLLNLGYRFAMYGYEGDPAFVRHIGAIRAPGWAL